MFERLFGPKEPVWTLDEPTLTLLRVIEDEARSCNLHIALGGSVLTKGKSSKDLDIFVYSDYDYEISMRNLHRFADCLRQIGITGWHRREIEDNSAYPVKRIFFSASFEGKTIEFFPCNLPESL